jgi:hypothetical protein
LSSQLLSVLVGVLTYSLFWWWGRRRAPRVGWSSALAAPPVSALPGADQDLVRVKVVHAGRRDAVEFQISAQLRIPHEMDLAGSLFVVELLLRCPGCRGAAAQGIGVTASSTIAKLGKPSLTTISRRACRSLTAGPRC